MGFAKWKNKARWLAEKTIKEQFAHHLLLAGGVILMLAAWKESTAFQSTLWEFFFRCVILYLISKLFLLKFVICVYAFENVQTV